MKSRIRTPLIVFLSLAALWIVSATPAFAEYFDIRDYHADIVISENNNITVTETIHVHFNQARHGIYREIPYKYRDDLGETVRMPIDVQSVKHSNGKPWTYKVKTMGNVVNIRIGDADRYVRGNQTYIITYRVSNAIRFFEDHDELYWNVTGNDWQAPIDSASARVTIDTKKDISKIQTACYTGRYGSSDHNCTATEIPKGAEFLATERLSPRSGFTVVLGWDKGIVSPPTAWQKFMLNVNPTRNWVFLIPIIVILYMSHRWYHYGRDPRVRDAIKVMYEPPKIDGRMLTPAEVGTLIDETFDTRDINAGLINLAVKGYMKLEEDPEDDKNYTFYKLKDADGELTPFETELLDAIFVGGAKQKTLEELKKKFYANLPGFHSALYGELVKKGFFIKNPASTRGRYMGMAFILLVFGFLFFAMVTPDNLPLGGLNLGIAAVIIAIFSKAMPAKTRKGALAHADILGFQEFMVRVEKDRIERLGGKDIFYRYLPYAIALNVVDQWSEAFKDLHLEPPDWYVSHRGFGLGMFSATQFARTMGTTTSHLSSAIFSAPRGSGLSGGGGGGGGFSGGGGGGGGGGSW